MDNLDDRKQVQEACFYVGWQLLSPHSWAYRDIFTGASGEVTLDTLNAAITAKKTALDGKLR